MTKWRKYPSILELHTKIWLETLSSEYGRKINFDCFPEEEIRKIQESPFDGFWLMGIWKRSLEARKKAQNCTGLITAGNELLQGFDPQKDIDASAYSIPEYTIESSFGTREGFLGFKKKIEPKKIILDFVPNHTSRDSSLILQKPWIFMEGDESLLIQGEAFLKNGKIIAMGKDPNFPAWNDTAQLDYSKVETREVMTESLKSITELCDGVRCDMAMLVTNDVFSRTWNKTMETPEEFWKKAVAEVKHLKEEFLFIAEVYWGMEWELQQQGFDYAYDKTLYDRLKYGENEAVFGHFHAEKVFYQKLVRFLENHDEERASSVFKNGNLFSASILTYLLPGMRLFYEGQAEGRKRRSPIQFTRWPEEKSDPETFLFFQKMLNLIAEEALHEGRWTLLKIYSPEEQGFSGVFSFQWSYKDVDILAVVNNTPFHKSGFSILEKIHAEEGTIFFKDVFSDKVWEREKESVMDSGLYFELEPHEFKIYKVY